MHPHRVEFRADAPVLPYPDESLTERSPFSEHFALIQFIVDTTGVARPTSLKFLHAPAALDTAAVRSALGTWRFVPANAQGCLVPQLVMTPLRWR